jgi:hypothetical protein
MIQRFASAASLMVVATACASSYVYRPDVVGPHGEHLVELACSAPDKCMDLARKTCDGDFDIVMNGSDVSGNKYGVSSTNLILVKCQNALVVAPGLGSGDSGDAG